MDNKEKILIVYGSLNSVPSPEGIAPAKVIYDTVEALKDKRSIQVLSKNHGRLKDISYDTKVFKHVKSTWLDRLLLLIMKLIFPYAKRKKLFVTSDDKTLMYYISVCRWLFWNRPALVVVHVSTGLTLLIKKVFPKTPILYYHHGTSLHTKLKDKQWNKLISGSTLGIISVNKLSLELANQTFSKKLPEQKKYTIYNGIQSPYSFNDIPALKAEGRAFLGLSADDFVYAYVGRVSPEKGIMNLIKAFHILFKEINEAKNVHLVIIGGAGGVGLVETETEFVSQCKEYTASNHLPIHFTGFLSGRQLHIATAAADAGILPTDRSLSLEGHPLAIVEFFSFGIPVIATDVGGIPEVIENNRDGFILSEYPYNQQLIGKMKRLYGNPDLLQEMGMNAYNSFQNKFTVEKMASSFEAILNRLNY